MKICYVCKSEDCGCSMDCDPTDHFCCAYGFDKSNCDCEECDTACSNENCNGEPKPSGRYCFCTEEQTACSKPECPGFRG